MDHDDKCIDRTTCEGMIRSRDDVICRQAKEVCQLRAERDTLLAQRLTLLAELARLRTIAKAHGAPSIELGMTADELIARNEAHPAPPDVVKALRAAAEVRRG